MTTRTAPRHAGPVATGRGRRHDGPRAPWRSVGRSALARAVVLPISAVLGIIITRQIVDHYGAAAFASYGLLIGIAGLLPFADLGTSAAVVNVVAGSPDPGTDPNVRTVLVGVVRVVTSMAMVLVTLAFVLTVTDSWAPLLGGGIGSGGSLAAGACLALIGLALPLGLGQRALIGLGRNHVPIILQGFQSPIVLLVLLLLIAGGVAAGPYIAVVAYAATFLLAAIAVTIAARSLRPAMRRAFRDALRVRTVRGGKVFHLAWPMLVQMIALPIAMQTDRLIISHVCQVSELATYNLASQMYMPVWQLAAAAGTAFWPVFARARAERRPAPLSPTRAGWVFAGGAAVLCLLISALSGWLSEIASGGTISLSFGIVLSFSVLMVLQAAKYPPGMYMTDASGLRFQAFMILLMLPVNLGASWWLAVVWGPAGPVVGSAVSVLLFQVVANFAYVRRHVVKEVMA